MEEKIRFKDYAGDGAYVETDARKLTLALPAEITTIPCVKNEIERLKLTTWQYNINGSAREGTFYWNDGEKAWKYYERGEIFNVLDGNGRNDAADILVRYLDENTDDDFPRFSDEDGVEIL